MRLTCPNCGAQYEVPDKVIPPKGRDVQCSNCDTSWFFAHPNPLMRAEPDLRASSASFLDDDPADEAKAPPAPPRRKLDPSVSAILQQEAERETRLRSRDRAEATDSRPAAADRADAEASETARKARERMAHIRGDAAASAASQDRPGRQGGKLPNIDEINSTLRRPGESAYDNFSHAPAARGSTGFMRGITLTILLAALLALAYTNARTITEAVPQTASYMELYVAKIDEGRVWLDTVFKKFMSGGSEPLE
ncbi:zinc-ribbon domain-containing protein [Sedimentitalea sp. XS_ASV28]|uniref:zinc-ribbon domain-containing protein n=1 Tax=Sedimentitalea sp. XS_ASV28 TaxID=3241296 RepID=UPI0035152A31